MDDIDELAPDGILISPGPGRPEDAGVSNDVLTHHAGRIPIFGVCLGLQCMGQVFGGNVVRAPQVMHGKTSLIRHDEAGMFAGLPNPLEATRYHSLIVDRDSVPECLEITATTDDGLVMGLRHRELRHRGRAVPSRIDLDDGRPRHAAQLPRADVATAAARRCRRGYLVVVVGRSV